jgi:DNA-binding SARP family transcriptional activator
LLKGFELTLDGIANPLTKGPQHLLAYLALQESSLPRAHVAGVLWAEVTDERAGGNLRSALWRLRQLRVELVDSAHDCLSLSPQVRVDVRDAYYFAKQAMDPRTDVRSLMLDSLKLEGELLPGWYDDWIVLERERQRQICLHALEALCDRWTNAGRFAEAVMAGLAAVAHEPLRESAHRVLIKAYLAEGNCGEAIRQYGLCRDILRNELQVEPSAQLAQLVNGYRGRKRLGC